MNSSVSNLPEPATVALADRVRAMKAEGKSVIALQTGDPDFSTPSAVIDAANCAMRDGLTHYGNSRGLPALLDAIAERTSREHGVKYEPSGQILVTCGGVHAYFCALQAILSSGDEVLVPDPAWMTHRNLVTLAHGVPVSVPAHPENGFFPSIEAFERALTSRTRALVVNSPNNPTGMVASKDYLQSLNEFAGRHSLYIISDEVYDHILFDDRKHVCFAGLPEAKDRTIVINSLSKTYAMTGWRVGYLLAPEPVIKLAQKVSQHSITCLAPFVQRAAAFALVDTGVQEEADAMARSYQRRRALAADVWSQFPSSPIACTLPQGAFYLWLGIEACGIGSIQLAESLLMGAGVAVVPGVVYGQCGEGYLRVTIAASEEDITIGCRRLLEWCQKNVTKN